jgi:cytoskeletal protein CcmA (bactofilin family)
MAENTQKSWLVGRKTEGGDAMDKRSKAELTTESGLSKQASLLSAERTQSDRETVLGSGCRVLGQFVLEDGGRIEGYVEGEVNAGAQLVIGECADVRAKIQGQHVKVFGKVQGDISCSVILELFAGARVEGNLISPRIVMHDGVVFDGHCYMNSDAAKVRDIREKQSETK